PELLVEVTNAVPLSTSLTVTFAPGTTAPVASRTVPTILPVSFWAHKLAERPKHNTRNAIPAAPLRRRNVPKSRLREWSTMRSMTALLEACRSQKPRYLLTRGKLPGCRDRRGGDKLPFDQTEYGPGAGFFFRLWVFISFRKESQFLFAVKPCSQQ